MPAPARRITPQPRRPSAEPTQTVSGNAAVSGRLSIRGHTQGSKAKDVLLDSSEFPVGAPLAQVKVAVGKTIDLGNYEFLRIDVAVTLPCLPEHVEGTKEAASNFVAEFITQEETSWLA